MNVSLGRAEATADLSWIEGVLATKEKGRNTRGEARLPQSQPQGRGAERSWNGCNPPVDDVPTGSALTMDGRLVPERATFSVGAFALVCRDDRVKNSTSDGHDAAVHGLTSDAGLGKLEISTDTSHGVLEGNSDTIEHHSTAATDGAKHASLEISWTALTATTGEQPSVPERPGFGLGKPELPGVFHKFFSRNSGIKVAPTGVKASLNLGEVRIQCLPFEAEAQRGAENPPASSSGVVVRNISVDPSVVVVQSRQPGQRNSPIKLAEPERAQQPTPPPARGTLAGVCGTAQESKMHDSTAATSRGRFTIDGGPDDKVRPPRQSPPPLPPRPSLPPRRSVQPMELQRFQVPEVKVRTSIITGNVDAGLAGWLNLRGLREAEGVAAKERRMAKLLADGKRECRSVAHAVAAGRPDYFPQRPLALPNYRRRANLVLETATCFAVS